VVRDDEDGGSVIAAAVDESVEGLFIREALADQLELAVSGVDAPI